MSEEAKSVGKPNSISRSGLSKNKSRINGGVSQKLDITLTETTNLNSIQESKIVDERSAEGSGRHSSSS